MSLSSQSQTVMILYHSPLYLPCASLLFLHLYVPPYCVRILSLFFLLVSFIFVLPSVGPLSQLCVARFYQIHLLSLVCVYLSILNVLFFLMIPVSVHISAASFILFLCRTFVVPSLPLYFFPISLILPL